VKRLCGRAALLLLVAIVSRAAAAQDGARYSARVAPEASFTNIFGMVMYGAPAFTARHTEILSTFFKGTTKTHVVRRIRVVTPDVAIVDIDNQVRGIKTMPAGGRGAAWGRAQDATHGGVRAAKRTVVDRGVSQRRHQAG
jgi:uncharacterized protein (TIGR02246 family)